MRVFIKILFSCYRTAEVFTPGQSGNNRRIVYVSHILLISLRTLWNVLIFRNLDEVCHGAYECFLAKPICYGSPFYYSITIKIGFGAKSFF